MTVGSSKIKKPTDSKASSAATLRFFTVGFPADGEAGAGRKGLRHKLQIPGEAESKNLRYDEGMTLDRITIDPKICTGKPCIRGLRFPVSRLLGLLAAGETKASILKAFPYLEPEDIGQALAYAAFLSEEETVEFTR